MAIGDSISAGFAINDTISEIRGEAFPIGGDVGFLTLPNLLQVFNEGKLFGPSEGSHILEKKYIPEIDHLNAAHSGARSTDLDEQIQYLLKIFPKRFTNEWKHLSLLIGSNDLCAFCKPELNLTAANYRRNVGNALSKIREYFPKTIVSLISQIDFRKLYEFEKSDPFCAQVHEFLTECECAFSRDSSIRKKIEEMRTELNNILEDLENQWIDEGDEEFMVIFHQFNRKNSIEDVSLVSSFDCFHPSKKAHQTLAVALFNSLLTPPKSRKQFVTIDELPICPSPTSTIETKYSKTTLRLR